jgi:RsiW-degrading membrane proteinase PrsW (M82 family)
MIVLAYAIAILLPLGFLYLIYAQDLYGQGKFGYVLLSFGWGLAAFGAAYGVNVLLISSGIVQSMLRVDSNTAIGLLPVLFAPIVEEVLKSLVLIFLSRRMTYFVDGAIYGFASGIAFSVLENILYLSRGSSGTAIVMALLRVFSTCLMHGAASALVGTAIGRLRYGRGLGRVASAVLGWALAIGLHMGFNRVLQYSTGLGSLLGALGIGIGGAGLIIVFIRWGLTEEKRWIQETLGIGTGTTRVSASEVQAVGKFEQIDELLRPVVERFGEEKIEEVEKFLLQQARMGIKRKARALSRDPREQEKLGQEIEQLHEQMNTIRRKVGVYCMSFVRAIFPEDALDLTTMLGPLVQQAEEKGMSLDDPGSLKQLALARLSPGSESSAVDEQQQQAVRQGLLYGRLGGGNGQPQE